MRIGPILPFNKIKKLLVLGFSWLNHQGTRSWEGHCGSMETEVHHSFGNIFFCHLSVLFDLGAVDNKLMAAHYEIFVVEYWIKLAEFSHQVVGVQDGVGSGLLNSALAQHRDVPVTDCKDGGRTEFC